jgi:hypothetical protein
MPRLSRQRPLFLGECRTVPQRFSLSRYSAPLPATSPSEASPSPSAARGAFGLAGLGLPLATPPRRSSAPYRASPQHLAAWRSTTQRPVSDPFSAAAQISSASLSATLPRAPLRSATSSFPQRASRGTAASRRAPTRSATRHPAPRRRASQRPLPSPFPTCRYFTRRTSTQRSSPQRPLSTAPRSSPQGAAPQRSPSHRASAPGNVLSPRIPTCP